ncbi:L,D-transpeptidase family protein [Lacrimispora defluvii]|uniref:L,D-transpeptidase family protein n=1 Tax=Lacrimispora defluvii TaxID=2719233 RepID=A0ABX1VNY1_9FIRM|nr:L,D-transpeptidase family protein [Lacrimispora defluvii]NNJ30145.1 L,D-transpeptidase family protein [Lacrimispora defluvii]
MNYEKMSACEKREAIELLGIIVVAVLLLYLLISYYFTSHFFFSTTINGADVSLKNERQADQSIRRYTENYKLLLIEREGKSDEITGQEAGLEYKNKIYVKEALNEQKALQWIGSLFKKQEFLSGDLFFYNENKLNLTLNQLNCFKQAKIEPENVSYQYTDGHYQMVKEIYGNRVEKEKLKAAVTDSLFKGETKLDLDANFCYINPVYTMKSPKAYKTLRHLNKCASTHVTYLFGSKREVVDGNVIQHWIAVDENLDIILDKDKVRAYVKALGKKYDTVGVKRSFKTSLGTTVDIEGGIYGWKIDEEAETSALAENINSGRTLIKEPAYIQKAVSRAGNEIGETYVEINITRQHMWFYKDGRLIAQGPVVTGNPNRGNATVTGAYMLNYKQEGAVLSGPGYEAGVQYWMPFYGNIGIHDAKWRRAFGGEIYKKNGTHGCVNAPYYLAKTIYKHIESGIPIICYEEK